MMMGMKSIMMVFLLGFMMNGILAQGVQASPDREIPGREVGQPGNMTQKFNIEVAQTDKAEDEIEKESILVPEQKKRTTEPAKPKTTTKPKQGLPKVFFPSEKIPADQAVDFPTDI
jgi:hypothetical protein